MLLERFSFLHKICPREITYKALIVPNNFSLKNPISQFSKGVNNDTENDILKHQIDNHKEENIDQ